MSGFVPKYHRVNISTSNLVAGKTYVYTIGLNDGTTMGFRFGLK